MDSYLCDKFEERFSYGYVNRKSWLLFCEQHKIRNTSDEMIWRIKNRIPYGQVFTCAGCGKPAPFANVSVGFRKHCNRSCSSKYRDPKDYGGFATPRGQAKSRQTLKEKTGYEYALHDPEIFETQQSKRYKTYTITTPSGIEYRVQGYERFVVPLLWEEVGEQDLVVKKSEIPKIWYEDEEGNRRKYYPDAMIKSTNTLIEVKSSYTIRDPLLPYKLIGATEAGYNIEVIEYGNGMVLQRKTFFRE